MVIDGKILKERNLKSKVFYFTEFINKFDKSTQKEYYTSKTQFLLTFCD